MRSTSITSTSGVVLMSAELFESTGQLCSITSDASQTCSSQCHPLRTSDYNHLLWTTLAEFPGIMVSLMLIEKIGMKKTMALEFFLFTITICLCRDFTYFLSVIKMKISSQVFLVSSLITSSTKNLSLYLSPLPMPSLISGFI